MSWQATRWARDQVTGSAAAKAVLMILAEHVGDDATCFLSVASMSERSELGRGAVIKHLGTLEAQTLIRRRKRHDPFGHRTTDEIVVLFAETQGSPNGLRDDPMVHETNQGEPPKSISDRASVHLKHGLGSPGGPDIVLEKVLRRERAAPSRAKPATPIPEGFPDQGAIGREQLFLRTKGWDIDAALEAESFRGHALNKGRTGKDWPAAFHNWIIKAIGYAKPSARIAPMVEHPAESPFVAWRQRIKAFANPANRYWNATDWGPAPGRDGCKAPAEIVAEFIADPSGKVVPIGRATVA